MATEFKVETVKWTWADKVQSKNVYRDDEFVRTKTHEETLDAIGFLLNRPRGMTYTITVMREGEYFTYWRHTMPCLGGLVKYRDSHGDKHYMNPYFPRDIYVAFPEGDIKFIGYARPQSKSLFTASSLTEFMFSQESPWVSAFGTKETIILSENYFILTNMDTDPTVFYSLMRLGGVISYGAYAAGAKAIDPRAQLLAYKHQYADPRRLAAQKPLRISGGTWAQGYGYTRPYNESIFKTSLPHKLSQFGTLAGYPQAPHTNAYFVSEMKSVFGVDWNASSKSLAAGSDLEKVLIKAWDHFKEKAKELSESTEEPLKAAA